MFKHLVNKNIDSFLNSRFKNNGKKVTVNDDTFFIFTTDPHKYLQNRNVEKIYRFYNNNCPLLMKCLVHIEDTNINCQTMDRIMNGSISFGQKNIDKTKTYFLLLVNFSNDNNLSYTPISTTQHLKIDYAENCTNILYLCADDNTFQKNNARRTNILQKIYEYSITYTHGDKIKDIQIFYIGKNLDNATKYIENQSVHNEMVQIYHIPIKKSNIEDLKFKELPEIDIVVNEFCPYGILLEYLDEILEKVKQGGIFFNKASLEYMLNLYNNGKSDQNKLRLSTKLTSEKTVSIPDYNSRVSLPTSISPVERDWYVYRKEQP
jgi:hypothetical protein